MSPRTASRGQMPCTCICSGPNCLKTKQKLMKFARWRANTSEQAAHRAATYHHD